MTAALRYTENGQTVVRARCLRFTLLRDRYLPYASLQAEFASETGGIPQSVEFLLDGRIVFSGLVRQGSVRTESGLRLLRITARSWSEVLMRNQLLPGMRYQVTLASLMTDYHLPHMTYETGTGAVRYLWVKERIGMWDALIAYNYKLNGGYPYLRVPNLVCVTPQPETNPVILPQQKLLRAGECTDCRELISRVEMADLDGEYGSYAMDNPAAAQVGAVQTVYIPFDRQYLFDPTEALSSRIARANRRLSGRLLCYDGYCGEDLEDKIVCGAFSAHVSRITVTGSERGVQTEDICWFDSFCNRT